MRIGGSLRGSIRSVPGGAISMRWTSWARTRAFTRPQLSNSDTTSIADGAAPIRGISVAAAPDRLGMLLPPSAGAAVPSLVAGALVIRSPRHLRALLLAAAGSTFHWMVCVT